MRKKSLKTKVCLISAEETIKINFTEKILAIFFVFLCLRKNQQWMTGCLWLFQLNEFWKPINCSHLTINPTKLLWKDIITDLMKSVEIQKHSWFDGRNVKRFLRKTVLAWLCQFYLKMEERQIVTWSMEINKANYYYIVINIGPQIIYFGLGLFYFIKVGACWRKLEWFLLFSREDKKWIRWSRNLLNCTKFNTKAVTN